MLEFVGTERYRVIRQIGEGGMGIVYEVDDLERGEHVALKMLKSADVETFYRMKREFRTVADLGHPNVVGFYDMVVEPNTCYFTMELVDGQGLVAHCRPDGRRDETRLRAALAQLVRGMIALHESGIVHRDLKPSNVMVTGDGRVVLLDFGLSVEARRGDSLTGQIVGTVDYMAPEQAAGEEVSAASDWYSTGVLLYEALTGKVPFSGPLMEVLLGKQEYAPPPPRAIDPTVPEDLDDLCVALLSRDPERRPSGAAILRRLGIDAPAADELARGSVTRIVHFAGRAAEMEALSTAFASLPERASAVVVRGPSGIGKSALVREYVRLLEHRGDAVVCLSGRCYERETVPYKGLDGLVNELAAYLLRLGPAAAELLPERAALLRRLFPVLGRVPGIAEAAVDSEIRDPLELRAQAFGALRELLGNLARASRLVMILDDLQWIDENTVALLADVMRPPDPPPLLLVLVSRKQEPPRRRTRQLTNDLEALVAVGKGRERTTGLARLVDALDLPVHELELAPLSVAEAEHLAGELLGSADCELARRVARAGGGVPFFIGELCMFLQGAPAGAEERLSLEEVLRQRIGRLPARARELLELASIAGEPLPARVAAGALGGSPEIVARDVRYLRTARFLRPAPGAGGRFEPFHDRIRDCVVRELGDERRRALHRSLALAMVPQDTSDPEALARHWYGAGESQRAAELAQVAAERAVAEVNFERAAALYQMVLDLGRFDADEQRQLVESMGNCLANAGRPEEAAAAFALAAEGADPDTRLDLHNQSAGELLRGGYVEQGLAAISRVLGEIGLRLARTPRRALWSVLWRRAWLRLRGLRWRLRRESELPKEALTKLDILSSVAISLGVVNNIRGADYQTRHVLMALRLGEPSRVSRALGVEAGYRIAIGKERGTRRMVQLSYDLRKRHGMPQGPFDLWAIGALHYFRESSWRAAIDRFEAAQRTTRRDYHSRGWTLDTLQVYTCFARLYMGDLRALAHDVPAIVREAEARGDLYAAVNVRNRLNIVWLVRDDVAGAERDLEASVAAWQPASRGYQVQHYWALISRCELELYRGDSRRALELVEADLDPLRRSMLLWVEMVRLEIDHLQARAALAVAVDERDERRRQLLVRRARKHARRLERMRPPVAGILALLVRAAAANLSGDREQAIELLRRGHRWAERTETMLFAVAAGRRLGQLVGGEAGEALVADSDAAFAARGVVDPAAMTRVFVPGFPD